MSLYVLYRIEELTLACQKLNSDLHDERRKNAGFQNNAKQMRQGSTDTLSSCLLNIS